MLKKLRDWEPIINIKYAFLIRLILEKNMLKTRIIWLVILLCVVLSFHNTLQAAEYEITDLGNWNPVEINNNGQIVGNKDARAVLWQGGTLETICDDLNSNAVSINDSGQVAIDVPDGSSSRGYFWEDGTLTLLGNGPWRQPFLYVSSIDNCGRILCGDFESVGSWLNGSFSTIQAGILFGDTYYAKAGNNLGDVLGVKFNSSGDISFWSKGEDLPSYPLTTISVTTPMSINDNKQIICGDYFYKWGGWIVDQGSVCYANNNLDEIVGEEDGDAFLLDKNGRWRFLKNLIAEDSGWELEAARAINDKGQIVCYGSFNGISKVCLLTPVTMSELSYPGTEFPVNYETYGTFSGNGTGSYNYETSNPVCLAIAVGEGIYPNTESVLLDLRYQDYLQSGKLDGDIWNFVNSDDPWADFFKWATAAGVQDGEKLFYTALALENCGEIKHSIKAYYALIMHFPFTQAFNPYENIYWYPGIAAIDAISRLTRDYPEIGYELVNAKITVGNGYDSNPSDDVFTASSGEFIAYSLEDRVVQSVDRLNASDFTVRGSGRVQVVKRIDNSWQLRVDGKPFQIQGITYSPTQVGMVADDQTAWQWLDTNDNGLIDAAEEAWVDTNHNNLQDADEPSVGDFQLLKDMGCNTIRIFHYAGEDNKTYQPEEYNKPLLRRLYNQYGIMVMMGDFFGGYTIGSGADWEGGTDYTNPEHRAAIKEVVRQMVLDHKDEPYVLMWLLGNENNMAAEYNGINATRTNAASEPQAYAEFLNEVAKMIHEIDPDHPVAVGNLNLGLVEYYAQYAPELDIIATNHYTDFNGVGVSYLREAREKIDRPLIISEYGADAYHQDQGVNELEQKRHHYGSAKAIYYNSAAMPGEGILLGGIVFEWLDEWWKAQSEYDSPFEHQTAPQFYWGIMPDHFAHEEWFGLCGQGNGMNSPFLRETRQAYDFYKTMWQAPAKFDQISGTVTLTWDGYPGLTYAIEYADGFLGTWAVASTNIPAADIGRTSWVDDGSLTGTLPNIMRRYYRIILEQTDPAQIVLEANSGLNQIPIADDQTLYLKKNQTLNFSLTAWDNDNDPLEFIITNGPVHGTITGTAPNITYTPNIDFLGQDTIDFVVSDGIDQSEPGVISLNVLTMIPGTGLQAEYYNNTDFSDFALSRVDETIDFNWAGGSPDPSIGVDTFSARWSGQVGAQYNEEYTFYTLSDDGVRLWVNGQLLIDNWTEHAPTEDSGIITLAAGEKYDIVMEYYEQGGGAEARLFWSSASTSKQIIPQTRLFY